MTRSRPNRVASIVCLAMRESSAYTPPPDHFSAHRRITGLRKLKAVAVREADNVKEVLPLPSELQTRRGRASDPAVPESESPAVEADPPSTKIARGPEYIRGLGKITKFIVFSRVFISPSFRPKRFLNQAIPAAMIPMPPGLPRSREPPGALAKLLSASKLGMIDAGRGTH